ncbi:Inosine-uridine preferring nucleoside hydrolase [Popillia japonica]|uniref:Inosine-uridine preferring nucleoside hydrolase n=1 Tax=Popillia japonica TaxID=7064 RepID=A0AAW1KN73_POPJA
MLRVILDLDAGTDDTVALLVLLKAEKDQLVKIEAICCSNGNSTVSNVCRNVVRILKLIGRTDIPIYQGAQNPIICPDGKIALYHGEDGFGDLHYDEEPDLSIIQKEPSAIGMNAIVSRHPGEIYLVCLGPLTNVALAMILYKDFASSLKEIYIMGGNYKAIGNVTRTAEFNFHVDPESVHIILRNAKCPISILPWETCAITKMTMDWRFEELGNVNDPMIQLLNKAEKSVYRDRLSEHWYPCDAFLAITLIYPECIRKEGIYHATIELNGKETRGQVVLDHLNENESNVRIIKRVNENFVQDILYKSFRTGFAE